MKIAIVGTGAMGSVYAAVLSDAGHEVWAIDTWKDHIDAIRRTGLRVEGASGKRLARIRATTDPREAGLCDLVVIATKAYDVEAAAKAAAPLVGPETAVVTIQNGLGSPERAVRAMGSDSILIGVVGGFGASVVAPGHVHHNGWEMVRFGELKGGITPRLERVANTWRDAGFKVAIFDHLDQMIWEKFIFNVAFSGPCALTGLTIGQAIDTPAAWEVSKACAVEAFRVARARDIPIHFDDPVAFIEKFGRAIHGARPSMLLDHMARRRSEIDVINGAVPPAAAAVGFEATANVVVSNLVRLREREFG